MVTARARCADTGSCELFCFFHATGRACSSGTPSVDRRGPPALPRAELGINGLTSWERNLSRFV